MKTVNRISVWIVLGQTGRGYPRLFHSSDPVGTELLAITVYGRADKCELSKRINVAGDTNQIVRFRGDFAAYPRFVHTGEQYRSGVLLLPVDATQHLAATLAALNGSPLHFGFEIYAKKEPLSGERQISVAFRCVSLFSKPSEADPLLPLASVISQHQAAARAAAAMDPAQMAITERLLKGMPPRAPTTTATPLASQPASLTTAQVATQALASQEAADEAIQEAVQAGNQAGPQAGPQAATQATTVPSFLPGMVFPALPPDTPVEGGVLPGTAYGKEADYEDD